LVDYVRSDRDELLPLTGLRAAAAGAVVLFHFARGRLPDVLAPVDALFAGGYTAVSLFFVLSGFVLAWSYRGERFDDRASLTRFFRARFARVYPLYAVSLALGFVALMPKALVAAQTAKFWYRTALAALLLNAFDHRAMFHLNWAAWSLSAEALYYVAFPFLARAFARRSPRSVIAIAASLYVAELGVAALYLLVDPDGLHRAPRLGDEVMGLWYLKFSPIVHLPEFVAGVAAGTLLSRGFKLEARFSSTLAALVLTLVAVFFASGAPVSYALVHSGLLTPAFVALIAALATSRGRVAALLSTRVVLALGRASYATYILHVPLFLLCARIDPRVWSEAAPFAIYLVVLYAVSLAAHRFVEEPMRRVIARAQKPRFGPRAGTVMS
jgi:peptidoglycan/LPS O-acetylase OafA/YrhL